MNTKYKIEERNELTGAISHTGAYLSVGEANAAMQAKALRYRKFVTLQVCQSKGDKLVGERIRGAL